jgi:hypothetical protein
MEKASPKPKAGLAAVALVLGLGFAIKVTEICSVSLITVDTYFYRAY